MKKGLIVLLLLGMLFVLPLVQAQTYSGFDKFTDNIKLFFSFGDNKIRMALEIREKQVNSAMENFKNGNEEDSSKNLEKAWKKLQLIQRKVSPDTAEEIKENSNEMINLINNEGNLSNEFDVYVLEEEKTGLTAEWVIEMNGKEGQNKTNVVVVNGSEGNRVNEIENRIDEIDGEISNWVVVNNIEGEKRDNGLTWEVKTEVANGDNGLKPEVKTYVAGDGTLKNDELPEPDLNQVNPDLETHDTTTNEIVEGDGGEGDYAEGTTAGGIDLGNTGVNPGTPGVNEEPGPAVDSNEGN